MQRFIELQVEILGDDMKGQGNKCCVGVGAMVVIITKAYLPVHAPGDASIMNTFLSITTFWRAQAVPYNFTVRKKKTCSEQVKHMPG